MGRMNLHHVELFYHVARHGGISRAVRHMPYGIQQPAISSQILLLEQDLGVKLFDRQPFRLTAEGQELYAFARPFFEQADEVGARLRGRKAPKLRIAASELILRDYLPGVLDTMRTRHPHLRFALRSGYTSEMEAWLQDGEIDLAVTPIESRRVAGLKYLSIVQLPLVLLVHARSRLRDAKELWAQDGIEEGLICLPANETTTRLFRAGLRALKVDWPTSLEASSTELAIQYVANGYGVGVTVQVPQLARHAGVRVLPLPGFGPVEIAAMWRPPVPAWHDDLRAIIADRAQALWPGGRSR
jgi:DNA-binding transcriptional LysR family regulator